MTPETQGIVDFDIEEVLENAGRASGAETPNEIAPLPVHEHGVLVETALVGHARRLAQAHGLTDVAGLLGGASNRAAEAAWEEDQR